jgi:predicted RND superfamily exporter protein
MTTVAMTAGMAPIALGFGADASFRRPMAVAVIGGLITSTALSLLVVPVVFTYVDRFKRFLIRLTQRRARSRSLVIHAEPALASRERLKDVRRPTTVVRAKNE